MKQFLRDYFITGVIAYIFSLLLVFAIGYLFKLDLSNLFIISTTVFLFSFVRDFIKYKKKHKID